MEGNLEKKGILRESLEITDNFFKNILNYLSEARPLIKPCGQKVLKEYHEAKAEIYKEVAKIDKRLNRYVIEEMAEVSLDELEHSMFSGVDIDSLKELFSRHERLREVLKRYDGLEFNFNQDENQEGKIYPEEQNQRYLRLEDKFRKMKLNFV